MAIQQAPQEWSYNNLLLYLMYKKNIVEANVESGNRMVLDNNDFLIYTYPVNKTRQADDPAYDATMDNLTIGDLHSNAIKLIHILIQNGVADLKTDPDNLQTKMTAYENIVNAYLENNCMEFSLLLEQHLVFSRHKPFIRFIGDTLADRGVNDLFIIDLYQLLKQNKVTFEVLLSNHDGGFLNAYYAYLTRHAEDDETQFTYYHRDVSLTPATSIEQMSQYIHAQDDDLKIELLDRMLDIFENAYLPNLKFIGYEFNSDSNTLTLNTHAPFGLNNIKLLAEYFGIELSLDEFLTARELITTIDEINSRIISVIEDGTIYQATHDGQEALTRNIVTRIMWQRVGAEYDQTDFIAELNGINFRYRHGHDQPNFQPPANVEVLDNMRGKTSNLETDNDMLLLTEGEFWDKYETSLKNVTSDYIASKGLNCRFYKMINRDMLHLDELVNHHGVKLFDNTPRDMNKINVLKEKIQNKIKALPQDQREEFQDLLATTTKNLSSGITSTEAEPETKRSRTLRDSDE